MNPYVANKFRISIILGISLIISHGAIAQSGSTQNQANRTNQQIQDYGYCLTNVSMTTEQKAKVEKLQQENQAKLAVLRNQLRSTRDWDEKDKIRMQMDDLRTKHQEEVWAVVPEAKQYVYVGRPGSLNGRRYYCRGRASGAGYGKGYGRGAGRGYGAGYGNRRGRAGRF